MAVDADRTLAWPDGTIYRITRSSEETGGSALEMEWELPAGGWAPRPHVHPQLTEEYEVLDGSFEILVGREWRRLTEGESASISPGTVQRYPLLYTAMLVNEYPRHSRAPGWILSAAVGPLAVFGRLLRLKTA